MQLESGTRLGEYEIVAPVGAGGMGEVYRARDHRLGRDVAVKILPEGLLDNQDRLQRFQREAQSAGGLNHPNLLTIHELGVDKGRPFIVSELLDGSTLRERMAAGPMAPKRAIEYASQIAEGLAAAHERGIVHRDLKPENVFVTRDGRVKILDFGLAKSVGPVVPANGGSKTMKKALTDPGAVVGTVGYMSPEQVRGDSVDARSDIFTLGAILYEMLSGRRAFHGTSSVDTMHAILHEDPPELSQTNAQIPPALARIAGHCLEKDPEGRFQSARDLAFALSSMSATSTESVVPKRRTKVPALALWIAALAVVGAATWFVSRAVLRRPVPQFRRLTFRSFGSPTAAFTADQQSIVYSSQGPSGIGDIEIASIGSGEARPLGVKGRVLAISRSGDLAVLINARFTGGFIIVGTLARVPLGGGAPREIANDVQWADWNPSGDQMAILRSVGGKARIEMPIGTVRYAAPGWITTPKISPDGKWIAFVEHPVDGDDAGSLAVIDTAGNKRVLTPHFASMQGLAWTPGGKEIWFTGAIEGNSRALYAVAMSGQPRLIVSAPGVLTIHDIARDGRVLLDDANVRQRLFSRREGEDHDRELSWLDWSLLRDISPDGRVVLFDETGEGAGSKYGVYIRGTDGSPAIRLGDGIACALSPDGRSALAAARTGGSYQIFAYPTGAGDTRQVTTDASIHTHATWTPDAKSVVVRATDGKNPAHLFLQPIAGGAPRLLSARAVAAAPPFCSPDGRWVTARGDDGVTRLFSLRGEGEIDLPEIASTDSVVGWTPDSRVIRYFRRSENPVHVQQLDIATRRSTPLRDIAIPDAILGGASVHMSADGRTYAYTIVSSTSDLYLLDLK